jgi:YD repeat-containing protein
VALVKSTLACAAMLLVCAAASAQQHPNLERGFKAERVYNVTGLDSVNVFNGNLTVSIPLGLAYPNNAGMNWSLRATYNSKLWEFEQLTYTGGLDAAMNGTEYVNSVPGRRFNAGLGWLISMGRLIAPDDPVRRVRAHTTFETPITWVYETPSGADHEFGPVDKAITTDGSHLRLRYLADGRKMVEFPDGSQHIFESLHGRYRLTEMKDPFGNTVRVEYDFVLPRVGANPADASEWRIIDQFDRTAHVRFREVFTVPADSTYRWVVRQIDLPAFNGGRATYDFEYDDGMLMEPGCTYGWFPPETQPIRVPVLRSITLPDSATRPSSYAFDYNADIGSSCHQGTLRSMSLPTGGSVHWTYQLYTLASGGCYDSFVNLSSGVHTRTFKNFNTSGSGEADSVWTYDQQIYNRPCGMSCGPRPVNRPQSPAPTFVAIPIRPRYESQTSVTGPSGLSTVHYFSAMSANSCTMDGVTYDELDYGLPFTRRPIAGVNPLVPDDGVARFLSTEVYDGTTLLRRTYVTYDRDALPLDSNERVIAESTVYKDGGDRAVHVLRSGYDGYGHYRVEKVTPTSGFGHARETETTWNPGSGPTPSQHGPLGNDRWLLNTYGSVSVRENGKTAKTEVCFDQTNGFLKGRRVLASTSANPQQSENDIVTLFGHDDGNIVSEKWYGGEFGGSPPADLCSPSAQTPTYELSHLYANGLLAKSRYGGTDFDVANFLTDRATGLVKTSFDPAGVRTDYDYDLLGRLKEEKPNDAAISRYVYSSGTTPATVEITRFTKDGQTPLARGRIEFDLFGRVRIERQSMADGTLNIRETLYDKAGRKSSVSEPARESNMATVGRTRYTYDALDRPRQITSADGHITSLDYPLGPVYTDRTVSVGTSPGNETPVTTREVRDAHGRLVSVIENLGNAPTTTDYEYDVGGRLSRVGMGQQVRRFVYDGRGFLTEEQHPEKPEPTFYRRFDAKGHAREQQEGSSSKFHLDFEYDKAERLIEIKRHNGGAPLKAFGYEAGTARLTSTTRHNYAAQSGLPSDVIVTEQLGYFTTNGRLFTKTTAIGGGPSFTINYGYDDLGNVTSLTYPVCTGCVAVPSDAVQTLQNRYTNGFLTEVQKFTRKTAPITYHPNGMVSQLTHANGVVDVQAIAGNGMARPQSISFTNWHERDCVTAASVASRTTSKGQPVTLSVTHDGTGVSYEWYAGPVGVVSGTPLSTTSTLTVSPIATQSYWVRVRNSCGSVDAGATVAVSSACVAPSIVAQPVGVNVLSGTTVKLRVAADGTKLSYQWRLVGSNDVLETTAEYTFIATQIADYEVRVVSLCGGAPVTSLPARVTIVSSCSAPATPTITSNGVTTVGAGWEVRLQATSATSATLQWQQATDGITWTNISGATSSTVIVRPTVNTSYRLQATNHCSPDLSSVSAPVQITVRRAVPSDFNGDGISDIVWRDYNLGDVVIWNGPTPGASELYRSNVGDRDWRIHAIGDLNGDGYPDLVWRHETSGQNAVWFWNGSHFGDEVFPLDSAGVEWKLQGAADFSGDSKADLVFRNYRTGEIRIWYMDGQARPLLPATLGGAGTIGIVDRHDPAWKIQAVGDFDQDNLPDLLWRKANAEPGRSAIWYGNASLAPNDGRDLGTMPINVLMRGAGDYDGDGRLDVLWQQGDSMFYWSRNSIQRNWLYQEITAQDRPAVAGNSDYHVQGVGEPDACAAPEIHITLCSGSGSTTMSLHGAPAGSTIHWLRDDGFPVEGATTLAAPFPAEYTITVTTAEGCSTTIVERVEVPEPALTASSTMLCDNGSVTLTASGGTSYQWSTGATGPTLTVSQPGSYSVRVFHEGSTCYTDLAAVTITAPVNPAISAHPVGTAVTAGGSTTVQVTATNAQHYQWFEGVKGDVSRPLGTNAATLQTPALFRTTSYWVRVRNDCRTTDSNAATVTVLAAPRLSAAAASPASNVDLAWTAVAGAQHYEIWRSSSALPNGDCLRSAANGPCLAVNATTFRDATGSAGASAFLYRVRAVDSAGRLSPWSNTDLATTIAFTNDPLQSGQVVSAVHFTELRQAVNAVRALASLALTFPADGSFAPPPPFIQTTQVQELRGRLGEALQALAARHGEPVLASAVYDDSPLVAGTPVRAVHIQQLRNRLK